MVACHHRHITRAVYGHVYTVRNTAGCVGLNALEYIMQTVSENSAELLNLYASSLLIMEIVLQCGTICLCTGDV